MSDIRSLPLDLVEQITRSLSPPALRCLHGTSRNVEGQPTSDFVTGLLLRLPASQGCHGELIMARLPHVATLSVQGSVLCDDDQQSSLGAGLPELLKRICPSMVGINFGISTLILYDIDMAAVAAATPHIVASCPQLTCLKLLGVKFSEQPCEDGVASTLRALAAVPGLRRLKITLADSKRGGEISLAGIGALVNLEGLSLAEARHCNMGYDLRFPLDDLSRLVGLRKLTLRGVNLHPWGALDKGMHLGALTRLQHVNLMHHARAHSNIAALSKLAACSGLTSVRVSGLHGEEVDGGEGRGFEEDSEDEHRSQDFGGWWRTRQHRFAQLTRLEFNVNVSLACSNLVAMPTLSVLHCGGIILPPRDSPVSLPQIRAVKCTNIEATHDGAWPPARALASTLPQLQAAAFDSFWVKNAVELLFPTPEARLAHLRRLAVGCPSVEVCGQLTGPVEQLLLGKIPARGMCTSYWDNAPLAAIISLMNPLAPTMRRVALSHTQLDDECLEALVAAWPHTEEVTLWGADAGSSARHVTDAGLAALRQLRGLRRVRLIRCSAVTPTGISILMAQLSVEHVEVCGCEQVGSAEVAALHNLPSRNGVCYGLRPSLHLKHSAVEGKAWPRWGVDEV